MKQGILAGILALFFLMFSVVGYTLETPEEELPEELLDLKNAAEEPAFSYGDTIVDMARKEYDYYHKNHLTGGGRYWAKVKEALGWTYPDSASWCVAFVLCCANECGYIAPDGPFGDFGGGDWIFWVGGLYSYMVNNTSAQGYNGDRTYRPQSGDLILFDVAVGTRNPGHIGIVESVDDSGAVHTIEGNSESQGVGWNTYMSYQVGSFAYYDGTERTVISGYIHPIYPEPTETTEPTGPTEPTMETMAARKEDLP